ncbi:MAG: hypothetical protein LBS05_02505 [Tannerellaceae bacterium]|jgi:hypothetical protein|nr:hypothetical protein [Tannerellaceae bacterium]
MKKYLFLTLLLCLPAASWGQSATQPSLPTGVWQLAHIYINNISEPLKGSLPPAIYYSCPVRIEVKAAATDDAVLHFDNGETRNVSPFVYEYQNKLYLHLSFQSATSTPEYQYSYIIQQDEQSLLITLDNNASPGPSYTYYYTPLQ